ncbi:MAG: hypothetical protein AAFU70_03630, partial [Planctomycetota bacterium]
MLSMAKGWGSPAEGAISADSVPASISSPSDSGCETGTESLSRGATFTPEPPSGDVAGGVGAKVEDGRAARFGPGTVGDEASGAEIAGPSAVVDGPAGGVPAAGTPAGAGTAGVAAASAM